ncbi:MAG TPA: glucokinase [Steroidobacteraceae bacterium]|nr:glucokinase [Steroidobacteraceae bacterium]
MTHDLALVADVGGTYARLALARRDDDDVLAPGSIAQFDVARFGSLERVVDHYLEGMESRPVDAVLAVAGPVAGDEVRMTNSDWRISRGRFARELNFESVRLVNDFAALSAAIPSLSDASLEPIGPHAAPKFDRLAPRVMAVIGPGTGLGVGVLLVRDGRLLIIDTEGGHSAFAPNTAEEREILNVMSSRFGRVSNERLVSSSGLLNLYEAACAVSDVAVRAATPEAVTAGAANGDTAARRSVELFCEVLGALAGDVVLMTGAWDGVYLAGGLIPPLLPWLKSGKFRERFESKGRIASAVASVPTTAITQQHPGLIGAGALAFSDWISLVRQP